MTQEKTEIQKLNDIVKTQVEEKVEALKGDLTKHFAVHTSRKSSNKFEKMEGGKGLAFKHALPKLIELTQKGIPLSHLHKHMDKDFTQKFLGEDSANGGGNNAIPVELADDVIPALYAQTLVSQWGARMIPMSTTKMEITRQNLKPTASYIDEGVLIPASNATFGKIQLDLKKLTARSEVANEFLSRNSTVSMNFIYQDMIKAHAQAFDEGALRGAGGVEPLGIFAQIAAGNKFIVDGATAVTMEDAFDAAELAILNANHPHELVYAMAYRDFLKLRRQRESGLATYPGMSESSPIIRGHGVICAQTILRDADDSGTGSNDESRIYVGSGSNILVGVGRTMRLEMSAHEKFSSDMTVIRLVTENDVKLRYSDAISVISTDYSS